MQPDFTPPNQPARPSKKPTNPSSQQQPSTSNKSLLRLQKPIFDVYHEDKYASQKEYMISMLLKEKKKPKIQMMPPSSLLEQVKTFLPKLKEANQQLGSVTTDIQIDKDMERQASSSESSEEQQNSNRMMDESETQPVPTSQGKHIQLNIMIPKIPQQMAEQQPHPQNTQ